MEKEKYRHNFDAVSFRRGQRWAVEWLKQFIAEEKRILPEEKAAHEALERAANSMNRSMLEDPAPWRALFKSE